MSVTKEIKANTSVSGKLSRIYFDVTAHRAFFSLQELSETFVFYANTREQVASLALSREGDQVSVKVGELPHSLRVCTAESFVNLDMTLQQD
jgi:hypothetical protein